jgi:hypothetical protein
MNENAHTFASNVLTYTVSLNLLATALKTLGSANSADPNKLAMIATEELVKAMQAKKEQNDTARAVGV